MTLAQIDPHALLTWLQVVAFVAGIVTAVAVAYSHLTGRSGKREIQSPLEVKAHPGVVTREEWEQTHGRISRERREVDAAIAATRAESEKRYDKLEAKIDTNTALTTEMSGEVKHMNQALNTLGASLTSFLRDQANKR